MLDQALPAARAEPLYVVDAARPRRRDAAIEDVSLGFRRWRLAWALAWLDIRNRYRGSVLGPFWMSLSTAVMVGGLGLLYSSLFKLPLETYLPFLGVGLVLWATISQIVTEACTSLTGAEGIIRQVPLPFTVHILRNLFRNAIVAAHSLPVLLLVFALCNAWPGWAALAAIPGLLLLLVNTFSAGLFLGMVCARFRDIPPIIASALQLVFFMSPVLWKPELLGRHAAWLPLNPFYVLLETIRGPLVEGGAPAAVWLAAVGFTAAMAALAAAFFVRFRGRIAFWV